MTIEELKEIFSYHAPRPAQIHFYERLRDHAHSFAAHINMVCPESREKSLAITKIQEAVMWANAAIAIHDKGE